MRFLYYLLFLVITVNFSASAKPEKVTSGTIKTAYFKTDTRHFPKEYNKADQQDSNFFVIDQCQSNRVIKLPSASPFLAPCNTLVLNNVNVRATLSIGKQTIEREEITTVLYTKHFFW